MALGNVNLTPQLIQAVRDAADIVTIAGEHTRLRKAGRRYQGLCPLHKEKSPSFSVDPVQGLFYCFGCGQGGDAIKLHMLTTGDDFPAAIESLAGRFGIPLPRRDRQAHREGRDGRDSRDIGGALAAAAEYFASQLKGSAFAREYLAKRAIPPELVERFGLGYAPDSWDGLRKAMTSRVPLADLEAAGLVGRAERTGDPYDRFRHRLMFPIHNPAGRLVGFGGRTLGDDRAKYVNTAETDQFHKGNLLYGLHHAKREIRESGRAVLVEGYFDVIGTVASGVEGAVAGMGTALTPEQARLLSRYAEVVVVGYDGDGAGEGAFRRALPLLLAEKLAVRRARFGEGHDPDSLRLAEGPEAVARAMADADDAILLEMERLIPKDAGRDPHQTAVAGAAVRQLVGVVADPVARHNYLRRAAERLGIAEKVFLAQIADRRPAAAAAPPSEDGRREFNPVRSLEERVLERLLNGMGVPARDELPVPGVFLDPQCRNIYQVFCTLYGDGRGSGSPPDVREVLSQLGSNGGSIDRMAQILVEAPAGSKELESSEIATPRETGSAAGPLGRGAGPAEASFKRELGLPELLAELTRRFEERRLRELASEINEAQRKGGDDVLLTRLYDEKRRLSLSFHRRPGPGAGKGAG
jgi:DNA primase